MFYKPANSGSAGVPTPAHTHWPVKMLSHQFSSKVTPKMCILSCDKLCNTVEHISSAVITAVGENSR